VFASAFPSHVQPIPGVFVKERVRFVSALPDFDVRVMSPVPYFPPIRGFTRWYPFSQMSSEERINGLQVIRPRYPLVPKLGAFFHPRLMYLGSCRAVSRCYREFPFEVIDSHFIYPDGVAATMFAQRYRRPVVLTGRGEEILRFPKLPVIGKSIRWALRRATRLVALSEEIASAMRENGADPARITVIPNGVDGEKFHPVSRAEARARLNLPPNRPIVLSVGYRLERKGFHILVDAIPQIRKAFPSVLAVIVGGSARWGEDYTTVIEDRIKANGVAQFVRLVGPRAPEELADWYSAADAFVLLTSREGSPNVLMEALACGIPVIATRVGGIPDVLSNEDLGILLEKRTAGDAALGIVRALQREWDRELIRRAVASRTWTATAAQVRDVLLAAIADDSRCEDSLSR
jgi:glycosyltransferase involved in cell wall biosynthesis